MTDPPPPTGPQRQPAAPSAPPPPPGWYPDVQAGQRYWDGARWTEHIAPPTAPVVVQPAPHRSGDGLVVVGVLTAIFLPLIGFIIGIVLSSGRRPGAAAFCIVVSILMAVVWASALDSASRPGR